MHIGQRHFQPGIFAVDRTALPVTHTIGEIQILQCHRFRRVDHKNTVRAVAGNVNICHAVAVHIAIDRQPDIDGDLTFQRDRASLEAGIEGNGVAALRFRNRLTQSRIGVTCHQNIVQSGIEIFNRDGVRLDGADSIFQIPVAADTGGVRTGGNICTGRFCDHGAEPLPCLICGEFAAVDHDICIGSQVFADGFPLGGIEIFSINRTAVQQEVAFIAVSHDVERIVFRSGRFHTVEDLAHSVTVRRQHQHFLTGIQRRKDRVFVVNRRVDHHQFFSGGEIHIVVGKQVNGHGGGGVLLCHRGFGKCQHFNGTGGIFFTGIPNAGELRGVHCCRKTGRFTFLILIRFSGFRIGCRFCRLFGDLIGGDCRFCCGGFK